MSRLAGLSSGEVAAARNRRSVKFEDAAELDSGNHNLGQGDSPATDPTALRQRDSVATSGQQAAARPTPAAPAVGRGGGGGEGAGGRQPLDLALKHRAGLLHRPPPMHLQSSYQHDYGQKKAPVGAAPAKAPILEATRTLMRDGQGRASSAPSGAALQPFQAATEYQRNYQRWAQPAAPPPVSRSDLPTRREGNFLLEDVSSDEEEDERHQHQQESHPTQLKYAKLDLPAQQARVPVQPAAGMPSSGPAGKQVTTTAVPAQAAKAPYAQLAVPVMHAPHQQQQQPLPQFAQPQCTEEEQRLANLERARRFRTEYQRTFCEPAEKHLRSAQTVPAPAATELLPAWYDRVLDLRQKARKYRSRSLGTFFSRSYFDELEGALANWETDSSASSSRLPDGNGQATGVPSSSEAAAAAVPSSLSSHPVKAQAAAASSAAAPGPVQQAFASNPPTTGGQVAPSQHGLVAPGVRHVPAPYSPSSASVSSASTISSSSSSSAIDQLLQHVKPVNHPHKGGAGEGRVSTPNLPPDRPRHHLDRTTPGHPAGLLLESPERPQPHRAAHCRPVTEPTVRANPKAKTAMPPTTTFVAPGAAAAAGRPKTAAATGRPYSQPPLDRSKKSSKSARCTCGGAEIGPGPYNQRHVQPQKQQQQPKHQHAPVLQRHHVPGKVPSQGGVAQDGHPRAGARPRTAMPATLARSRAPLCDSLSSLSSQSSATAQVLQRAKQRHDTFWTRQAPPATTTVAAH
eukprot:scpid33917/ scgid34279/ 